MGLLKSLTSRIGELMLSVWLRKLLEHINRRRDDRLFNNFLTKYRPSHRL